MASGVRDDVSHEYTCFIRRGEDEHLHGRFLSALGIINVRGQILSVLDLKKFFDLPERGLTDRKVIVVHNDQTEFGILAAASNPSHRTPLAPIRRHTCSSAGTWEPVRTAPLTHGPPATLPRVQ